MLYVCEDDAQSITAVKLTFDSNSLLTSNLNNVLVYTVASNIVCGNMNVDMYSNLYYVDET